MGAPQVTSAANRSGTGAIVVTVLVGGWTATLGAALPALAWLVEQALLIEEVPRPAWLWPLAGWSAAVLAGVPAYLLARIPRAPAIRASGRCWTVSALLLGVLGSVRAVPTQWNEAYLALFAAVAFGSSLALAPRSLAPRSLAPRSLAALRGTGPAARPAGTVALGLVAGLACLLPWLLLGALGGLLETVLAVLAAAATGRLAAALLQRTLWPGFARYGRLRLVLLGGLVAGAALVPLAAAVGGAGANLLAVLALPPLGFLAAELAGAATSQRSPAAELAGAATSQRSPAAEPGGVVDAARSSAGAAHPVPDAARSGAVAIGLAAAGPLAFVEPVQATILLGLRDVGFWALLAALAALAVAIVLAIVLGIGYGLTVRPDPLIRRSGVAAVLVAVVAAADLTGYVALGHPGLYGDGLFVVLKARADLSGTAAIADVPARRAEVYRRLVATADGSQRALRHDLSALHLRYTPYYLVNGLEVDGGPAVRAWLSRRPEVARVLLSPRLRPVPRPAAPIPAGTVRPDGSATWNVRLIGADRVWASGDTGTGIVVGTSDTGVDGSHPALAGAFRGGDDSWYDPWNGTRTPTDHNGHGTHTLGTVLGRGGIGVAPGAQWMGCVNLDRNLGNPAHYLDCLQYMLAPFPYGGDPLSDGRPDRAADVLTNSWGCAALEGCDRGALRPAVDALAAAGIFVVAAAGNAGPRCGSISDPPAPYPDTLTVGAVDRTGRLASYSSRGPVPGADKPDVVAPGTGVLSAVPGGGYRTLTGTSMAAPHVAGVVALMWAANRSLIGDVARTAAILRDTASHVTDTSSHVTAGDCDGAGAGLVDAYSAVRAARAQ